MTERNTMKIAIASGKGGTGKTTLSTNLAAYIAEREDVVLVDLDVEEPNSGLFFRGELTHEEEIYKMIPRWDESRCSQCGICAKVCNYHAVIKLGESVIVFPELCHSCYACSELCPENALPMIRKKQGTLREFSNHNLKLVESRLDIGEEQAVPAIAKTKKYVSAKHGGMRYAIFDCPPGTSCPVIEAVKDADIVILVTEPTPFGLHDLKLAVGTVRELRKPFGVVVNRFGIGNDEVITYCREQNIPLLATIPNNRKIAEMYSAGELVYRHFREVREVMEHIVNYCLNIVAEKPA